MRAKIILAVLFILTASIIFLMKPSAKESNNNTISTGVQTDSFVIGAFNSGTYKDYAGYRKANLNLWHIYNYYQNIGGYVYPVGWVTIGADSDYCLKPISSYIAQVTRILDTNAQNGLTSLVQRPKINYLSSGQSSIYQCEYLTVDYNNNSEWFYAYDSAQKYADTLDEQTTPVKFCNIDNPNHDSGYIVKNLRANRELCNNSGGDLYDDNKYDWYILPKIKVPQDVGYNTRVCRIEIINWEDSLLKYWDLIGGNFKDINGNYSGQYIDTFRLELNENQYIPMKLDSSQSHHFNPKNQSIYNIDIQSHFDIRVYWYRECNMWIDYIKVQNNIAYDLFRGIRDDWIHDEAQQIGGYSAGSPYKFYIDEIEYNHYPCIGYVNKKIMEYNPALSINSTFNITFRTPILNKNYY